MDVVETVFVPRYEWRHKVGVIAGPLLFAVCVFLALKKGVGDPKLVMAIAFFGLCTIAVPFMVIRRIRFGDRIIVDRYLFPSRRFSYGDVVDLGVMSIRMRKGWISLYQMKNSAELLDIFESLKRSGRLVDTQIEGTLAAKELLAWSAGAFAFVPAVVGSVVLAFLGPHWLRIDGRLVFLAVYLLCYAVTYAVMRRRSA